MIRKKVNFLYAMKCSGKGSNVCYFFGCVIECGNDGNSYDELFARFGNKSSILLNELIWHTCELLVFYTVGVLYVHEEQVKIGKQGFNFGKV